MDLDAHYREFMDSKARVAQAIRKFAFEGLLQRKLTMGQKVVYDRFCNSPKVMDAYRRTIGACRSCSKCLGTHIERLLVLLDDKRGRNSKRKQYDRRLKLALDCMMNLHRALFETIDYAEDDIADSSVAIFAFVAFNMQHLSDCGELKEMFLALNDIIFSDGFEEGWHR